MTLAPGPKRLIFGLLLLPSSVFGLGLLLLVFLMKMAVLVVMEHHISHGVVHLRRKKMRPHRSRHEARKNRIRDAATGFLLSLSALLGDDDLTWDVT